MATHSSILAWRILWIEEPGGIQPIGSQWVRHAWNNLAKAQTLFHQYFMGLMYRYIITLVKFIPFYSLWCYFKWIFFLIYLIVYCYYLGLQLTPILMWVIKGYFSWDKLVGITQLFSRFISGVIAFVHRHRFDVSVVEGEFTRSYVYVSILRQKFIQKGLRSIQTLSLDVLYASVK